jgi:hypothetical protein
MFVGASRVPKARGSRRREGGVRWFTIQSGGGYGPHDSSLAMPMDALVVPQTATEIGKRVPFVRNFPPDFIRHDVSAIRR